MKIICIKEAPRSRQRKKKQRKERHMATTKDNNDNKFEKKPFITLEEAKKRFNKFDAETKEAFNSPERYQQLINMTPSQLGNERKLVDEKIKQLENEIKEYQQLVSKIRTLKRPSSMNI